jgi:hypothetical protein
MFLSEGLGTKEGVSFSAKFVKDKNINCRLVIVFNITAPLK